MIYLAGLTVYAIVLIQLVKYNPLLAALMIAITIAYAWKTG